MACTYGAATDASLKFPEFFCSAEVRRRLVWPKIISILSIREGGCAHSRAWRRSRRTLFRLSLEKAAPRCPHRSVRAEHRGRHLRLWRSVLGTGVGIPARRRPRHGRCDHPKDGELAEHHAPSAWAKRRDRRGRLLLHRSAGAVDAPAAAGARGRRRAAI